MFAINIMLLPNKLTFEKFSESLYLQCILSSVGRASDS